MNKAAILLSVLLLYGFQSISGEDNDTHMNLPYEVEHTHIDDAENPLDVYSVDFYIDDDETLKIIKYSSARDEFYLISLTYKGRGPRMMTGEVVIDIDGYTSNHRDGQPYRGYSEDGVVNEIVTIRLDNFVVNDLLRASTMMITFKHVPPLAITKEGIGIVQQFINELDSDFNPFS